MLAEAVTWLAAAAASRPPAYARRMGYLGELVAIAYRARRCRAAWAPHLAQSRATVEAAMARCASRRTAVVLGAGLVLDVPVAALAAGFERVVLVDLAHLGPARRAARRHANVALLKADLTGAAAPLERAVEAARRTGGPLAWPEPGSDLLVDDPTVDLVVSANLLSQLAIVPLAFVESRLAVAEAEATAFAQRLVAAHLAHLGRFGAVVCLIADVERQVLDAAGAVVSADDSLHGVALPPGREWLWDVAPLGEAARGHAVRNRVRGIADLASARAG